MISVSRVLVADNLDVLAGTDIENAPADGTYAIYGASSQQDTELQVSAGGGIPARTVLLPIRTNSEPLMSDDMPVMLSVRLGTKVTVSVNIVTPGTACIKALFTPMAAGRRTR